MQFPFDSTALVKSFTVRLSSNTLLQNLCHIFHHTLTVALHYLVKLERAYYTSAGAEAFREVKHDSHRTLTKLMDGWANSWVELCIINVHQFHWWQRRASCDVELLTMKNSSNDEAKSNNWATRHLNSLQTDRQTHAHTDSQSIDTGAVNTVKLNDIVSHSTQETMSPVRCFWLLYGG